MSRLARLRGDLRHGAEHRDLVQKRRLPDIRTPNEGNLRKVWVGIWPVLWVLEERLRMLHRPRCSELVSLPVQSRQLHFPLSWLRLRALRVRCPNRTTQATLSVEVPLNLFHDVVIWLDIPQSLPESLLQGWTLQGPRCFVEEGSSGPLEVVFHWGGASSSTTGARLAFRATTSIGLRAIDPSGLVHVAGLSQPRRQGEQPETKHPTSGASSPCSARREHQTRRLSPANERALPEWKLPEGARRKVVAPQLELCRLSAAR
mmetsp:Transcript_58816/g.127246  ORF Transcript_58816/g.127246 Transcript_58816/m.127246 type:complete len:260 (+) Transcript_58816:475-1254(+)